MNQIDQGILRFDRFELDLTRGSLRSGDRNLPLRPKAFEMLRHLAQNSERLVSKQELLEAVWPNVFVSDDSLVQCIRELREKMGDDERRLIKTVPRRGYMLDAPLIAAAVPLEAATAVDPIVAQAPAPEEVAAPKLAWSPSRSGGWALGTIAFVSIAIAAGYVFWPSQEASVVPPDMIAERSNGFERARPIFKDCEACPEMVALPAGEFMMGSPKDEKGRQRNESLSRSVTIAQPIAIGRFEVTVDQFSAFIAETETPVSDQCRIVDPAAQSSDVTRALRAERGEHFESNAVNWSPPEGTFREQRGYTITGSHPATCISWLDAQAYVTWLRRRTGKPYRLPSEAEWEYAARAGTATRFSYGDDETELCVYARFADLTSPFEWRGTCRGEVTPHGPIPVGSLKPNPWGLFDMHGNVWEWVEDCWAPNSEDIPTDGSAASRPAHCEVSGARGGSWASGSGRLRSAFRYGLRATRRDQNLGFRVALPLAE